MSVEKTPSSGFTGNFGSPATTDAKYQCLYSKKMVTVRNWPLLEKKGIIICMYCNNHYVWEIELISPQNMYSTQKHLVV